LTKRADGWDGPKLSFHTASALQATPKAFGAVPELGSLYDGLALRKILKMVPVGYILLVLGFVVGLYWQVRFLVVTYNRSLWWFFGCLFVPFVDWIFLLLYFKDARKPFGLSLLGLIVAGLGGWMAGVVWPS